MSGNDDVKPYNVAHPDGDTGCAASIVQTLVVFPAHIRAVSAAGYRAVAFLRVARQRLAG